MKKVFFSLCLLMLSLVSHSQVIKGQITDNVTNQPVIGAYILLISDPSIGTVSDLDGNYSLALNKGKHDILFKFTGMSPDTLSVDLKAGDTLTFNRTLKAVTLQKVDVVVGKFDKKVEELTYSMEVIKPAIIDNKNTRSIESILDQTPGLNIMDGEPQIRGGSGFTFGVGSKVAVLVDDMPMLSGDAGRPEWGFIAVENIEQIEITKGASSVLSGPSALSGSIHIRTAYPKSKPKTKINLYSGFYSPPTGDSSQWWSDYPFIHGLNFHHSRIIKKNTDLSFGGNLNWDHGYIGGPIKGPFVFDTLSEEFTDKQMQHKKARFNFNLRRRSTRFKGLNYGINGNFMYHKTNLVLAWLDDTSGIFRAYPGAALLQNQFIFNVDPYVEFYSKIGVKHSLKTRVMYTNNEMTSNQSNEGIVYFADYQFKREFTFLEDKSFDFIGGLTSQFNDSRAEIYSDGDGDISNKMLTLSGYAEVQKDLFKIVNFSIGGRADYYSLNDTITAWNPIFRTGANIKLTQATYLRASYGQGYRFPTITERYISTAVGAFGVYANPDLQAEKSWNAEVGVNQGFRISKKYGAQIDVAAFIQEYKNTIEYLFGFWDPAPNIFAGDPLAGFKFVNTGRSKISGFDISLNGKLENKDFKFTHSIGYNYINPITLDPDYEYAEDYNPNSDIGYTFRNTSFDTTTNVLKYRFKHTFKADVEFQYKGFAVGYTIKYFSKMENLDRAVSDFEDVTVSTSGTVQAILYKNFYAENNNGNVIMDLRASFVFGKDYKQKFSIVSKNLMNNTYSLRPLKIEAMRSTVLQYSLTF